jgi:hypothetical protein
VLEDNSDNNKDSDNNSDNDNSNKDIDDEYNNSSSSKGNGSNKTYIAPLYTRSLNTYSSPPGET